MLNKDERTIAVYMKAGALMRLYKTIGAKLFDAIGTVISAADRKKLLCALHGIDAVCSNVENNMFRDHPDLSRQYTDVFYGSPELEPRSGVDKAVLAIAKETAEEITTPRHIPG